MTLAQRGGAVAPGYEGVRDIFDRVAGADACAFAAEVDGELVCDLATSGFPPGAATILYSGTKGVVATALLVLVERGVLDLDAPASALWPEFAANGKDALTLTDLLAHSAGLPAVERRLERADLGRGRFLAAELAAQAPMVAPGRPCYHALTWGWLAAELVVRAAGCTTGELVHDVLAGPRGLDLRIGPPAADPLTAAVVRPRLEPGYRLSALATAQPDPRLERVYENPPLALDEWADPDLIAIEAAAVNAVATARSTAALYGALARGALVGLETIAIGSAPAREGTDPLTGRLLRYGPTGYELADTPSPLGPVAGAVGHTGAGGGTHGAWPSLRTGFSFLPATLRSQDCDTRAEELLAALHAAVVGR